MSVVGSYLLLCPAAPHVQCYLVDGKLTGPDVATSAAPQRFGHKSIEDLLVFRCG
jgi:hypothetical protein